MAGVRLRKALTPDALVRALLTGRATPGKHAHFIVLLEEAPEELLRRSACVSRPPERLAGAVRARDADLVAGLLDRS